MQKENVECLRVEALIFEDPIENPEEVIRSFFENWHWQDAKRGLWELLRTAIYSEYLEEGTDKDSAVVLVDGVMAVMRAAKVLVERG